MARGDGGVYRPGDRPTWYCYVPAKPKRAVRGPFKSEKEARRAWRDLRKEIAAGLYRGPEQERLTVRDLVRAYRQDLVIRGKKAIDTFDAHARILVASLGHMKAVEVTAATINRVREEWLQERRKPKKRGEPGELRRGAATTDRYLEILRGAYKVAVRDKVLSSDRVPHIGLMKPDNRRKGFIEEDLFWRLYAVLPEVERDVCLFAYRSGWRRGEVEGLTWEQIDSSAQEAWLFDSKNGHRRVLPLEAELSEVIQRRQLARTYPTEAGTTLSPIVFHREGRPLGDWRKTWARACETVGAPGLLFHDFRRSCVRNLVRSKVSQVIAMEITGHRTRAVFDRYNISATDEAREAIRATVTRLRPKGENSYGTATV
jgi:integrase